MIDIPKKGKKFILARHFEGSPTHDNFKLVEFDIPDLQEGGKVVLQNKQIILYINICY